MQKSLHLHDPYQTLGFWVKVEKERHRNRKHQWLTFTPTQSLLSSSYHFHPLLVFPHSRWKGRGLATGCSLLQISCVEYLFLTTCLCIGQSQLHMFHSAGYCNTNAVHACFPSRHRHKRVPAVLADREPLHSNNEPCRRHTELTHMKNKHTHSHTHSFLLSVNMCVYIFFSPTHINKWT